MIEKFDGDHERFHANPAPYTIKMHGVTEELGRLEFGEDGELHFTGQADEGAKIFFEHVVGCNNAVLAKALELLKMANCPECEDNSGAYCAEVPGYDGEPDIEMVQCQFCDERSGLLGDSG